MVRLLCREVVFFVDFSEFREEDGMGNDRGRMMFKRLEKLTGTSIWDESLTTQDARIDTIHENERYGEQSIGTEDRIWP